MKALSSSALGEFREFALKGNVVDLAVGVIIGGAFGKIVSGIVDDLIMPLVGILLPGGEWRNFTVELGAAKLKPGHLLSVTVDFLIVALVLYVVVHKIMKSMRAAVPPPETTRECPACLEKIAKRARRCKFCTELVEPEPQAKVA